NPLAALLKSLFKQHPAQHFSSCSQPAINVDRGNNRFERVGKQGLFFPAAGLFFATPKPQVFSQAQPPSGQVQRTCVHNSCATLGELPFAPLRKTRQEVFARQKLKYSISQELQTLIIPGQQSSIRI